jgi:uncharacterized protein
LTVLPDRLAVCRLPADAPAPSWAAGAFVSVTRTAEELSVVCAEENVPDGVTAERGWRCLKVEGPLDFALTGVLAELLVPLAKAEISVFALATYDTDHLLVREDRLEDALAALERA